MKFYWLSVVGASLIASVSGLAQTVYPPVQLVTVTNPETPRTPPLATGGVDHPFLMGKFEVNNGQYAAFLNARAKSDPHGLYQPITFPDGGILRTGEDGSYSYSIIPGLESRPVRPVNFYKALRFANWLHNGGTAASDTENGAYTFGSNGELPASRNPEAKYFVPSENEWYKAAYYQPENEGGPVGSYWLYATRSNVDPQIEAPPGSRNSANYQEAVDAPTDTGSYTAAASFYGTFDQTGNVWEWNETAFQGGRAIRGGSAAEPAYKCQSTFRFDNANDGPGWEAGYLGFRIAASMSALQPHRAIGTAQVVNGFVVGIEITDPGYGYTNTPAVKLIGGGGTGAIATAVVENGIVVRISIDNPGKAYSGTLFVKIAAPIAPPGLRISVATVQVDLSLTLGIRYQLLSSMDLVTWSEIGEPFIAEDDSATRQFDAKETGQYFKSVQLP